MYVFAGYEISKPVRMSEVIQVVGQLTIQDIDQLAAPVLAVPVFIGVKAASYRADSFALSFGVKRRVDVHAAGMCLLGPERILGLLPHVFNKVAVNGVVIASRLRIQVQTYPGLPRPIVFVIVDVAF